MLREHLTQAHAAASRQDHERALQISWLWEKLNLSADSTLLDMTCGPGLYAVDFAQRGVTVTGIDFSPASINYARTLAEEAAVADKVTFHQQDVREAVIPADHYDAAIMIYGQLSVFNRDDALALLQKIYQGLRPNGRLCLELLNPQKVDTTEKRWWHTGNSGLWGDTPYLFLGEQQWLADEKITVERFNVFHLETGATVEIELCEQMYQPAEVIQLLRTAGFTHIDHYPAWDTLPLYDKEQWHLYIAQR